MKEGGGAVVVGVDVGTSGIKVMLVDPEGNKIYEASGSYPIYYPEKGRAEQDPEEIFRVFVDLLKELVEANEDINTLEVSLSSMLHTVMAVDDEGEALSRLLIWADNRSEYEYRCLDSFILDKRTIYNKTGCPFKTMYPISKIAWIGKRIDKPFKYLSIKDFIVHRMTGEWVTDLSIASGSGMMEMNKREWDEEIIGSVGLSKNALPEIRSPYDSFTIKEEWLKILGITGGRIVLGAGDGMLANLGVGALDSDVATYTIGTSGAIRITVDRPIVDPSKETTWCYSLDEDRYVMGAAINNGGIVLEWLKKRLKLDDLGDAMERIGEIPVGSSNLLFLPLLAGERSPNWMENYRGILVGLSLNHGDLHILRAAIEGITFRMRQILDEVRRVSGVTSQKIIVTGGFTRSPDWLQLTADVLGSAVTSVNVKEASAYGAAVMGLKSQGFIDDYGKFFSKKIKETGSFKPDPQTTAAYREIYSNFIDVYELFKNRW